MRTSELVSDEDFRSYMNGFLSDYLDRAFDPGNISLEDLSGNINRVKRVTVGGSTDPNPTFIVKHVPDGGRLARFPHISFYDRRLEFEKAWFDHAAAALGSNRSNNATHQVRVPEILHFDQDNRILILEDLGASLPPANLDGHMLSVIGAELACIHKASLKSSPLLNPTAEQNRRYVFTIHLDEPESISDLWKASFSDRGDGISLQEKLEQQSAFLDKHGSSVRPILETMEKQFRKYQPAVFTHGDLHTGSLLNTDSGIGIIDAELADWGNPAFDLGILCAHFYSHASIFGHSSKDRSRAIASFLRSYTAGFYPNDRLPDVDCAFLHDVARHCGAEILRRLIGPAGLTTSVSREVHGRLLDYAFELLVYPDRSTSIWLATEDRQD